MPAVFTAQPAHLGRTIVEPDFGHHFILQQFESSHGVVIHEAFGLLTGACVERAEQNGKIGDEAGHAQK